MHTNLLCLLVFHLAFLTKTSRMQRISPKPLSCFLFVLSNIYIRTDSEGLSYSMHFGSLFPISYTCNGRRISVFISRTFRVAESAKGQKGKCIRAALSF
ncbi:hypothetical protein GQ43DRAFT_118774 [Delitschia confertaspora ATCC 74209]|uniref:Secreted protein n=1 Tax=Delitschia confertaspora ATCC 74209 TaxID=1513339 RepID=A0A9P4JMU2_9PLEO|nr:hypothetical protein GQ43DRAFT_118774 [Delitschia confertaspora ATCC 74209]